MTRRTDRITTVGVALILTAISSAARAQPVAAGTAFTYQGSLKQAGEPLNASADFQLKLYDGPGGGASQVPRST